MSFIIQPLVRVYTNQGIPGDPFAHLPEKSSNAHISSYPIKKHPFCNYSTVN